MPILNLRFDRQTSFELYFSIDTFERTAINRRRVDKKKRKKIIVSCSNGKNLSFNHKNHKSFHITQFTNAFDHLQFSENIQITLNEFINQNRISAINFNNIQVICGNY